ncbi:MAG: AMP-binding protein, partial [Rhizorhabdus sp.]
MTMAEIPSREETVRRLMRGADRIGSFRRNAAYSCADRLEERAADAGVAPFILFEDRVISFAEANAYANRVARMILSAGLKKGDVAALMMANRPEYLLTWLGLAKAGIVAALINTSATGHVLAHAFRQVEAKALIVGSELAEPVAQLAATDRPALIFEQSETGADFSAHAWPDLTAEIAGHSDKNLDADARAGIVMADTLFLIFTSGTTGLPKAAKVSHLRFICAGESMNGFLDFGEGDVHYCVLPLYHGAGGMVVPSMALAAARPFVLRRKFSRSAFWDDVRRFGITTVQYIGEIVRYLLTAPPSPEDRNHSLRKMCGAGLRADAWSEFRARFGIEEIFEGLGSTEMSFGITNVDNRPGSCGRLPYPDHVNVRILLWDGENDAHVRDSDGRPVLARVGQVGEVVVEIFEGEGLLGLFEGYTSAEATEAKLLRDLFAPGDRWFRSGDLVRFDEDDYFWFVDRVGDTFRWKSENVSTQEVERALSSFAGPTFFNVYGVKVPGTEGQAGMAMLTYEEDLSFDPRAFFAHAAAQLASYA